MKYNRLPEISLKSLLKWKALSSFIPHFHQDADEVALLDTCTASHSTQQCVPHTPGKTQRTGYPELCSKETRPLRNSTKMFGFDLLKVH